ncbi:hypothetical protein BCF59_0309 [Mycoplasmopsis mustelae]|uniref:Lipoprotein n=1 Tax=Mycoplasmopsis mustelae TaxID=171289 RepID=A0A4R7UD09_9BACT|nr:hypothetical protein [Mycoplasmopsis mustelae]TDV24348.1 hypothetical protein BCF59_0309 [Mycoplasmopsis mustelae]
MKRLKKLFWLLSPLTTATVALAAACTNVKKKDSQNSDHKTGGNNPLVETKEPKKPEDIQQNLLQKEYQIASITNPTKTQNESLFLTKIEDFFQYNDVSEQVLKFKIETNASNITFKNLSSNNYIDDYLSFDKDTFINILKQNQLVNDEQTKKLSFKFDYHNIREDLNNKNNVVIPIKIETPIEGTDSKLQLYSEVTIPFYLKGIKLSTSDAKSYDQINKLFDELKTFLDTNQINVSLKDKNDASFETIKQFIDNKENAIYSFQDLNRKQLESMFTLDIPDLTALKEKYKNQTIKIFVNDVSFTHSKQFNQLSVKVRVANGIDNTLEVNKKLPFLNVGFDKIFTINFDPENTLLRDEKLKENLLAKPANSNIYNQNFEDLTDRDITVLPINNVFEYKKVSFQPTDYRNGWLTFIAKYNNKFIKLTKHIGVGKFAELFDTEFLKENTNAYNFEVDHLTFEDLPRVNASIYSVYGNKLFTGGYDQTRTFYTQGLQTPISVHVGEDYLTEQHTKILAPYDGEIVAVYYPHVNEQQIKTGAGVGTVMLIRVRLSKLNLSPKILQEYFGTYDLSDNRWVYIGFIHLDANLTLNNKQFDWTPITQTYGKRTFDIIESVSPKTPQKFNKGDTLAFIGSLETNGGWMPHVHVTTYANNTILLNDNDFSKELTKPNLYGDRVESYDPTKTNSNPTIARVDGVYIARVSDFVASKKPIYKVDPITGEPTKETVQDENLKWVSNPIQAFEIGRGVFNPNILFKLRGPQSFAFNLESFFVLSKKSK